MKCPGFLLRCVALAGLVAGLALGCGSGGSVASGTGTGGAGGGGCQTGTFRDCTCDDGTFGTQACAADGTAWQACACDPTVVDGGLDGSKSDAAPQCGDGVCDAPSETCGNCPDDCGVCPTCDLAPTCTGAFSIPTMTMALDSFDNQGQTMYVSGVGLGVPPSMTTCSDPELRMRVSQLQIHLNGASGSLEMFCLVQADDGQSSELMSTPDLSGLQDNNAPVVLSPTTGVFWGQKPGKVKLSQFNITITYECFKVVNNGAVEAALGAIAMVAGAGAQIPGNPYGWAFGIGGAAAAAAQAAVAAGDGAKLFLQVQQTIDSGALLELTNGRTWVIRQAGNDGDLIAGNWDWELDIEAWGCATPRGQMPM